MAGNNKSDKNLEADMTEVVNSPAEEVLVADAEARAAAIIAEAEKRADEIMAKAEAAIHKAETEADEKPEDELVLVRLFKDSTRYKDDVFVAVNGRAIKIKRGENVMIPKSFAEVLEAQDRQDTETANLVEKRETEFKAASKALEL